MALELKTLQDKLADANLVVDQMNTNNDLAGLQQAIRTAEQASEREQADVDELFGDRREKEALAKQMADDLDAERRTNMSMLTNLDESVRAHYENMKEQHEQMGEETELKQAELDELTKKRSDLEDELAVSAIKQEAMALHNQLAEMEARHATLSEEMTADASADDQKERLLASVKRANSEMSTMQRQIGEAVERVSQADEEMTELDTEMHTEAGEKNDKYRELRLKETQIDDFLITYESSKIGERQRIGEMNQTVVHTLLNIARNYEMLDKTAVVTAMTEYKLPARSDVPASKALNSAAELQEAHVRLQEVQHELSSHETRATAEVGDLRSRMSLMRDELASMSDVETLKRQLADKQRALVQERQTLGRRVAESRQSQTRQRADLQRLEKQLRDNDMHQQLLALERKWAYALQSHSTIRETVASRKAETDVDTIRTQCLSTVAAYNEHLQQRFGGMPVRHSANMNRNAP